MGLKNANHRDNRRGNDLPLSPFFFKKGHLIGCCYRERYPIRMRKFKFFRLRKIEADPSALFQVLTAKTNGLGSPSSVVF
ncbi:hypothetical protein CEXT_18061 [Caerostris extrusa]|uniref:Uncharacterized protein n=1 Tax=Caerostris extrusa TaxID=172846 RepID=A0AAV4QCC4_CAEEX|nr:hypothetical protein CEXT_18061 [Caerostris extrusa]